METYTAMRQFADSWALLAMVLFFLAVVLRAASPGRAAQMKNASEIPLDERTPMDFAREKEAKRRATEESAEPADGGRHHAQ
ncbi:MAG: cbb3-type cytochrome c oxidase subunit 3 [Pseudomonadota bacterium]